MNLHPAAAWPSSFNSLNVNANHGAQAQGPEGKGAGKGPTSGGDSKFSHTRKSKLNIKKDYQIIKL
jgi:hypothetical protein